jgi:hypothetical protein
MIGLGSLLISSQNPTIQQVPEIIPDIFLIMGMAVLLLAIIRFIKLEKIDFDILRS